MLDELEWPPLSQMRPEARLILFYNIINGLAQVPFEDVLIKAYKDTRRKHNMKFRQIGHTTSQYGQLFSLAKIMEYPEIKSWTFNLRNVYCTFAYS